MKIKSVVCIAMTFTMASANLAFAQGRGDRDRGDRDRGDRAERHDRADRHDNRRERDFDRHDRGRRGPPSWSNNRHAVPSGYHRWNRGDRLPPQYRDRQYVVENWRSHRLSPPPRGYHWVQYGSDYLLVAIATGVIMQLLTQ